MSDYISKILVLNSGSQSLKYKIFDNNLKLIKEKKIEIKNPKDYQKVVKKELEKLGKYKKEILKVCHRVVHGGEKFRKPIKITKRVLKELEKYNKLAPLHNPFNILGIKIAMKIFSKTPQFAVFDTGFYDQLPEKAYIYALPEKLRKKYGFRRFGFHGISHEYAAKKGAKRINQPFKKLKIISCHLGGGASITAIKGGRAIDTSMGFTPMEGLLMMTRIGDIDPGILLQLGQTLSLKRTGQILNYQSGIKGICGISNMKQVLKKVKKGDRKAKLALKLFVYRIQKYIGAYFAVLDGCDLIVFTGAIGSGSKKIRTMILKNLTILKKSKKIFIETNEELMIAKKIKNYE